METTLKKTKPASLFANWLSPDYVRDTDWFDWTQDYSPLKANFPSANTKETPKAFELELAVPGLERKDIHIEMNNHVLAISAEKKEEKTFEDGYTRKEFSYNSFRRSFTLPENVNTDKITAKYENGVLKVSIPKKKETQVSKVRQIEVV